jgi:guanylate kinase
MRSPLLLSGPSGIGKSYLAKHLQLNYECKRIVPITTRPRRPKEIHGVDYDFLTEDDYQGLLDDNALFMHNEFFGAKYGYSKNSVDKILAAGLTPVSEIYTPKLPQFLVGYPDAKRIFLMPISEHLLNTRMRQRGETEENIERRLIEGKKEVMAYRDSYRHLYNACYIVDEMNFKEMVKDIVDNFIPEGRLQGEGNRLTYGYALR